MTYYDMGCPWKNHMLFDAKKSKAKEKTLHFIAVMTHCDLQL